MSFLNENLQQISLQGNKLKLCVKKFKTQVWAPIPFVAIDLWRSIILPVYNIKSCLQAIRMIFFREIPNTWSEWRMQSELTGECLCVKQNSTHDLMVEVWQLLFSDFHFLLHRWIVPSAMAVWLVVVVRVVFVHIVLTTVWIVRAHVPVRGLFVVASVWGFSPTTIRRGQCNRWCVVAVQWYRWWGPRRTGTVGRGALILTIQPTDKHRTDGTRYRSNEV